MRRILPLTLASVLLFLSACANGPRVALAYWHGARSFPVRASWIPQAETVEVSFDFQLLRNSEAGESFEVYFRVPCRDGDDDVEAAIASRVREGWGLRDVKLVAVTKAKVHCVRANERQIRLSVVLNFADQDFDSLVLREVLVDMSGRGSVVPADLQPVGYPWAQATKPERRVH